MSIILLIAWSLVFWGALATILGLTTTATADRDPGTAAARRVPRCACRPRLTPSETAVHDSQTGAHGVVGHRRRRLHRIPRGAGVPRARASTSSSSTISRAATARSSPTACRSSTAPSSTRELLRRTFDEHDDHAGSCTSPASSTPASRCSGRCTPTSRTSPRPRCCSGRWSDAGVDAHRVLVERGRLRHAGHRSRDRGHAEESRSRPTASRSSSASGCCATRASRRACAHTSLRYFNVVGSGSSRPATTPARTTSSRSSSRRSLDGRTPRINGDDYATPDGTCVRDYIHVADLAHVARRGGAAARCRRADRAGLQPRQRRRRLGRRDHDHDGRGAPASTSSREIAPAPAGRPRPHRRLRRARPPAISTGGCATRSTRWCRAPGRAAAGRPR